MMKPSAWRPALYTLSLYVFVCAAIDPGPYQDAMNRQQLLGSESCMQVYTVPKQSVMCEPTPEVKQDLYTFRTTLVEQQAKLQSFDEKLDKLDPDKPLELPVEVKEKLETIEDVKQKQAGHAEYLKRLEKDAEHLLDRMRRLESTDRQEMARLIELQTNLIKVTLHHANISIHDEYIDKLTDSTKDLTHKLQQLELDLKDTIDSTKEKLAVKVAKTDEESKTSVKSLREQLEEALAALHANLGQETEVRLVYQNKTVATQRNVTKLIETLRRLKEKQQHLDEEGIELKGLLEQLQRDLDIERAEKMKILEKSLRLEVSYDSLVASFNSIHEELKHCKNNTQSLRDEFSKIRDMVQQKEHILPRTLKVADCQDALRYYQPTSGVYSINPSAVGQSLEVYCDMNGTDGWTVIQRRMDGHMDFFRNWQQYKEGFGDINSEYWLGLDAIYTMTNRKAYMLRVELLDFKGKWWQANYDKFYIEDESQKYVLHISGYHGDAGDSMAYHNGVPFSTMDNNNDKNKGVCATWCHGGWWYNDCFHSNLNGRYYNTGPYITKTGWGDGVVWRHIKNTNFYSLKAVVMKIKPIA